MKIPQFLYVPRVNTLGHEKIIIETRHNIYWQVLDFGSIIERSQYIDDNQDIMSDWGMLSANIHTKYPILLMCFRCDAELKAEQLVKIGNRACDWYVQFYLRSKRLTKPQFKKDEEQSQKVLQALGLGRQRAF